MEKIKTYIQNLSLKVSFILYVLIFTVITILLVFITLSICNSMKNGIYDKYSTDNTSYNETQNYEQVQLPQTLIHIPDESPFLKDDKLNIFLLNLISTLCIPFYSVLNLVLAATLFFKTKIKAPMYILKLAYQKISENDLDFTVEYDSTDEMGDLIKSFEKMRNCLEENNYKMWRQAEQRKQINAAFAHDLRTPLTILKGHCEILRIDSYDSETKNTAITMEKHIQRLERYVNSMSNLQKLEDTTPFYQQTEIKEFVNTLEQSVGLICLDKNKEFNFMDLTITQSVKLDKDIIYTVVENLVSNSVRYAKAKVEIGIENKDNAIIITVADDGNGFTKKGLIKATEPYYTDDSNRSEHFGLGLYISKVLCEAHGGSLAIHNGNNGAIITVNFIYQ